MSTHRHPTNLVGTGAIDVAKPYKIIWFGDIHGPILYKFIGLRWAFISQTPVWVQNSKIIDRFLKLVFWFVSAWGPFLFWVVPSMSGIAICSQGTGRRRTSSTFGGLAQAKGGRFVEGGGRWGPFILPTLTISDFGRDPASRLTLPGIAHNHADHTTAGTCFGHWMGSRSLAGWSLVQRFGRPAA